MKYSAINVVWDNHPFSSLSNTPDQLWLYVEKELIMWLNIVCILFCRPNQFMVAGCCLLLLEQILEIQLRKIE